MKSITLEYDTSVTYSAVEASGCEIRFGIEHCHFSNAYDDPCSRIIPVFLLPVNEWCHMGWEEAQNWAPAGFSPLGIKALMCISIKHPNLQREFPVVATGAPDDEGGGSAVYYPYLRMDGEKRIMHVPNWGIFSDSEINTMHGIFQKR